MKIADFAGKNICVLGYGREGKAVVSALEKFAPTCEITIADKDESVKSENAKHWLQVGSGWLHNLNKFDVIVTSPGIPPKELPDTSHLPLTTSTQVFLDTIADHGATIIGVTGSKGKSTTSSLIAAILSAAKKDVLLLGNIGDPAIAHLADVKKGTYVVLEMSSYQLMLLTTSPHIAVVTSFFPEHLDYHGSIDAYLEAKKHIARFQKADDMLFFNKSSHGAIEIAKEGAARKLPFSAEDAPVAIEETKLLGAHNLSNIGAATRVAQELGISDTTIIDVIKNFKGLPHRLEFVGNYHGIDWVDDAISTTPESTIAALDALGDQPDNGLAGRVQTIILGGQDRGYDFGTLGERIALSSVKNVILFPGSGPKIKAAIQAANAQVEFHEAASMKEAVDTAIRCPKSDVLNPITLLSTASPSYGMFKNFEDKGGQFQELIKA